MSPSAIVTTGDRCSRLQQVLLYITGSRLSHLCLCSYIMSVMCNVGPRTNVIVCSLQTRGEFHQSTQGRYNFPHINCAGSRFLRASYWKLIVQVWHCTSWLQDSCTLHRPKARKFHFYRNQKQFITLVRTRVSQIDAFSLVIFSLLEQT